jgi:hypothetical protein
MLSGYPFYRGTTLRGISRAELSSFVILETNGGTSQRTILGRRVGRLVGTAIFRDGHVLPPDKQLLQFGLIGYDRWKVTGDRGTFRPDCLLGAIPLSRYMPSAFRQPSFCQRST